MFEVRATFPFDDDFAETDLLLESAAGQPSQWSGAGQCRDMPGGREHGWEVAMFGDAVAMKQRIDSAGIDDCRVIIREM